MSTLALVPISNNSSKGGPIIGFFFRASNPPRTMGTIRRSTSIIAIKKVKMGDLFLVELLGLFKGVFSSCLITTFSVLLFVVPYEDLIGIKERSH